MLVRQQLAVLHHESIHVSLEARCHDKVCHWRRFVDRTVREHHSHLRRPEVISSKERRLGQVAEEEVGAQRGVEGCENQTLLLQA